jgi:hypothetical protein
MFSPTHSVRQRAGWFLIYLVMSVVVFVYSAAN